MSNCDNILILGDLNCTATDVPMKNICELYNLENSIKEATCYKNANNPIDVVLTNSPDSFHNSIAIETGLSDHHKMIITVLNIYSNNTQIAEKLNKLFIVAVNHLEMEENINTCVGNIEEIVKNTIIIPVS